MEPSAKAAMASGVGLLRAACECHRQPDRESDQRE